MFKFMKHKRWHKRWLIFQHFQLEFSVLSNNGYLTVQHSCLWLTLFAGYRKVRTDEQSLGT